jgi:hypothetical protein
MHAVGSGLLTARKEKEISQDSWLTHSKGVLPASTVESIGITSNYTYLPRQSILTFTCTGTSSDFLLASVRFAQLAGWLQQRAGTQDATSQMLLFQALPVHKLSGILGCFPNICQTSAVGNMYVRTESSFAFPKQQIDTLARLASCAHS